MLILSDTYPRYHWLRFTKRTSRNRRRCRGEWATLLYCILWTRTHLFSHLSDEDRLIKRWHLTATVSLKHVEVFIIKRAPEAGWTANLGSWSYLRFRAHVFYLEIRLWEHLVRIHAGISYWFRPSALIRKRHAALLDLVSTNERDKVGFPRF